MKRVKSSDLKTTNNQSNAHTFHLHEPVAVGEGGGEEGQALKVP